MAVLPGFILALLLAFAGQYLSDFIGKDLMGLPKSPISAIMMAIILGIIIRNTISLPATFQAGIKFGLVRVLRFGIVLLGIRLSLGEAGAIGLQALPIIFGVVVSALLIVTYFSRKLGLSAKLGTLIAVGTSICGATAIVATAPTINAKDDEVAYSVACITLFGVIAMLLYPFVGHWIFAGDATSAGLFLGTAIHETSQVAGAGLVYEQFYSDPAALDTATVTKLVRNLSMIIIIPLMAVMYHRKSEDGGVAPKWYTMIPLFIVGFAAMSLLRTVGDLGDQAFGVLDPQTWKAIVGYTKQLAEVSLAVAMASVGLGTSIKGLVDIGLKPLGVGLFSAVLVGGVSLLLISLLQ